MDLLREIKIYPLFYILLIEFTDSEILILIKELIGLSLNNMYKVEKIIGYNPKIWQYIIKWKKYSMKENL